MNVVRGQFICTFPLKLLIVSLRLVKRQVNRGMKLSHSSLQDVVNFGSLLTSKQQLDAGRTTLGSDTQSLHDHTVNLYAPSLSLLFLLQTVMCFSSSSFAGFLFSPCCLFVFIFTQSVCESYSDLFVNHTSHM